MKTEQAYISGAVALKMRYTKYSDNSMTNLLYLVALLLIATAHNFYIPSIRIYTDD